MPNWCENKLVIAGPENDIVAMLEAFGGQDSDEETCLFDFNKIVPYPKHLAELDERALEQRRELERLPKAQQAEYIAKHGWPKDGYSQGGYEWCIKNWGTKWPAERARIKTRKRGRLSVIFETAWSPPIPIIAAASIKFPMLQFDLRYCDPDMELKGQFSVKNGLVLKSIGATHSGNRGG